MQIVLPQRDLVVCPLERELEGLQLGSLAADEDYAANIDRLNHGGFPKADQEGRMTLRALIPGATYRIITTEKGKMRIGKEFQAVGGETLDLGDIPAERREK